MRKPSFAVTAHPWAMRAPLDSIPKAGARYLIFRLFLLFSRNNR
jgi:hypothetical protein